MPVYNLTVDGEHEYFANGILVSNCDAVLYAFMRALHWLHTPAEAQPAEGSEAARAAEEARMELEAEQAFHARQEATQEYGSYQ